MTVSVRPATPDDAESVHRMIAALAAGNDELDKVTSTPADVRRDAFGPDRLYQPLLAEWRERVAGLLSFYMTYSTYRGAPCLFIDNLYVEPFARRAGAGRALMAEACRIALRRNCCRLELHVLNDNAARGFYEKIGMAHHGELTYTIAGDAMAGLGRDPSGGAG